MATHWKAALKRISLTTGRGLLFLGRHLFALLAAIAGFIVLRAIPALWHGLRGTAFPALRRFYLWLPHRRAVVAGIAAVVAIAIAVLMWPASHGQHAVTDGHAAKTPALNAAAPDVAQPLAPPVALTLNPGEGAPGQAIALEGLTLSADQPFEVTVGGRPAAAQRLDDGRLQVRVPIYMDQGDWPTPPSATQAVEVRRNGRIIATSRTGLRVTDLPRAPGTTAKVQRSLEAITAAYERIFESLPADDEQERAHRRALLAVLRGLVSDGDRSLAAVLTGTSPMLEGTKPDLELIDALLASGGVAAQLEAFAGALGVGPTGVGVGVTPVLPAAGAGFPMLLSLAPTASPGFNPMSWLTGPKCRAGGPDFDLACKMQIHGLLDELARTVIKPTADSYANIILAAGVGPMAQNPANTIVSMLLSITNLVIGKIAPSLLPSKLTKFELVIPKPLIALQDMTVSNILVEARNTPQTITLNDLIDIVKATVGPFVKFNDKVHERLKTHFFFVIDIYMRALRGVDHVSPGASDAVNPGLIDLPMKTWGPIKVTDSDLVQLYSVDMTILSPQEDQLEWRGEHPGQTLVRAAPRTPGDRSKVLVDHSLCPLCVWQGGAFGEDQSEGSKRVAVDLELKASPQQGHPPLDVEFTWRLLPTEDGEPIPCTLDFGDGSTPERIADCTETSSSEHTYLYTSRLEADTAGSYEPTLRLDGSTAEGKTDVTTEWMFRAGPETGTAPVEGWFTWHVPWPADRKAPACELDPGDGGAKQRFDDCLATTEAEHRFERRGSFVPMLTLIDGNARDTKAASVSVAEPGTCNEDLLKHKTWTGTVSYSQKRDAWNASGDSHVKYTMSVRLGADMHERTRRQWRGADHLVQYYSPLPQGSTSLSFSSRGYDSKGKLLGFTTFSGAGPMQRQEPHMTEDGSSLILTLDTNDCTYKFHLQGQTKGSGERWNWLEGSETYQGHMWINSVWGEGVVTSNRSIQGSAAFPVLSRSQIEDNSRQKSSWVSEDDDVSRNLGEDNLGKVTVDWHFEAVD